MKSGDTYLAGLWQRHIFQHLCWKVDRSGLANLLKQSWDMPVEIDRYRYPSGPLELGAGIVFKDLNEQREIKRMPKRAPSWSWASVEAPIQFASLQADRIVAELMSHQVNPSGHDAFGRVASGWLVLKVSLSSLALI